MTYIIITIAVTIGSICGSWPETGYKYSHSDSQASYRIFKTKSELADAIKGCKDSDTCSIVGVIGCSWGDCKEYDYNLKTSPDIKNAVDLTPKPQN
jgi:hypothetical protein